MVYDPDSRSVILFGGESATNSADLNDTWEFDGRGWTKLAPVHRPPPRQSHHLAWDPGTRTVVLFGGQSRVPGSEGILDDTWTWVGGDWAQHQGSLHPASGFPTMAFDPTTAKLTLVLLGSGPTGGVVHSLVRWLWDGAAWQEGPVERGPTPLNPELVNDRADRVLLLSDDTTGAASPGPSLPGPSAGCCGPADPAGTRSLQTWTYNGHEWMEQHPSTGPGGPIVSNGDTGRPQAVARDGTVRTWTGSDWQRGPVTTGGPTSVEAVAYDDAHHVVVAYSTNVAADIITSATYIYDGTRWEKYPS